MGLKGVNGKSGRVSRRAGITKRGVTKRGVRRCKGVNVLEHWVPAVLCQYQYPSCFSPGTGSIRVF